ncbi:MAG: rhombotarget lipoprotein [Gammaproteobacteria bacterium HGW-Gammaproteobacteria-8]|nr:MAG: rhombotarget lipoprotein [Gammaproteobacteria bacterium HGW-Gammaproteobacteria-8]
MFRKLVLVLGVLLVGGCAGFLQLDTRTGASASVVDYLYPDGSVPNVETDTLPVVDLPARVGLAFVPSSRTPKGLTPADQEQLLARVRQAFAEQNFIGRIEVIPQSYLRLGGGFENLGQVARLYNVDIVALVSWDQLVQTSESTSSLLYWTLVGAYTIKGSSNEAITFVDTAVLDVPSQTLLFRAAGQHRESKRSTAIHAGNVQSDLARAGFDIAMEEMTVNLDQALGDFNQRVRDEGQVRLVDRRTGQDWHEANGGEGSFDLLAWLLLMAVVGLALQPTLNGKPRQSGRS